MTSTLFLGFVAATAAVVIAVIARYVDRLAAFRVLVGLSVWFSYAGLLGYFGVLINTATRPPGIAFLVVPVFLFLFIFIVVVIRSSAGARLALAFPLWIIFGLQSFRVGVELFLHQLWINGLAPKMLTFEGHPRAIGYETRARLERAGASGSDECRDSRRADRPRPIQPDPRRGSQSDAGYVSIPVYSGIFCAACGGSARARYACN